MKKLVVAAAALVALLAAAAAVADTAGIEIQKDGFKPADVTIESGGSVSWKNTDTVPHDVVVSNSTCKLTLQPQQSSACTFATPGSFPYTDPSQSGAGFNGKVTVAAAAQRSVSIAKARNLVIFGGAVTLSGATSEKKAGETVTLVATPAGEPAQRIQLTTGANGTWSLRVQPRVRTVYQAEYQSALSPKVDVGVRPRVTFQKVGLNRFMVVVLANRSLAGQSFTLTRWQPGQGWVEIGRFQLGTIDRTQTISTKTISTFVPLGTKLRIFMNDADTGADYLPTYSNFVVK